MADINGAFSGHEEAGIDGVMGAVAAADDSGSEEHCDVLGNCGRGGPQTLGDFAHWKRLALGKLTEDAPATLAGDGREDLEKWQIWSRSSRLGERWP